jgi:lipopolysaccharide export system permease protein
MIISRIDLVVLSRIGLRVGVTVLVFFALIVLSESLNTSRFNTMREVGGLPLAILAMIVPAARWLNGTLPITVLIGCIAAVLDLQMRHELTILKTAGYSIWRILLWPIVCLMALSASIAIFGETWTITTDRSFPGSAQKLGGKLWLEQVADGEPYILLAQQTSPVAPHLRDVTIYKTTPPNRERIVASTATYERGKWVLSSGAIYRPDAATTYFGTQEIGTQMTSGDFDLQMSLARDRTFLELWTAAQSDVSNPELRAVSLTSLYRAFTLPFMVAGSVLLAFALGGTYRRRGDYGNAVMLGLIVGFVLFVVNEMATRAGNSQVISPLAATAGPALLSVLAGATALLFREDGKI